MKFALMLVLMLWFGSLIFSFTQALVIDQQRETIADQQKTIMQLRQDATSLQAERDQARIMVDVLKQIRNKATH